jgi:hypothetical protein
VACTITITSVVGKLAPNQLLPSTVVVTGTAQECTQVEVAVAAQQSKSATVNVSPSGVWTASFTNDSLLGAKCNENVSVFVQCKSSSNCVAEGSFDLKCVLDCPYVDDISVIIELDPLPDPLCLDTPTRGSVILTAQGQPGGGMYEWDFGDNSSASNSNLITVPHLYNFPGAFNVQVTYTPTKAGCPPTTAAIAIVIPDCPPPPPPDDDDDTGPGPRPVDPCRVPDPTDGKEPGDGRTPPPPPPSRGGSAGCDALLYGAIAAILSGGLMVVGGVCGSAPLFIGIGAGVAALGVVLLYLWLLICGRASSCGAMQHVHCALFWTFTVGPILVIILGVLSKSLPCAFAIAVYWGTIGWLANFMDGVMSKVGCERTCKLKL